MVARKKDSVIDSSSLVLPYSSKHIGQFSLSSDITLFSFFRIWLRTSLIDLIGASR